MIDFETFKKTMGEIEEAFDKAYEVEGSEEESIILKQAWKLVFALSTEVNDRDGIIEDYFDFYNDTTLEDVWKKINNK